jgi:hypothetical protein
MLTRAKTFSRGIGYAETPLAPYEKNEGLECWWREAMKGRRFRYYRDGTIGAAAAEYVGAFTASAATTSTDGGKAYDIDPQELAGKVVEYLVTDGNSNRYKVKINSHTATVLTFPGDLHNTASGNVAYRVLDHRYETYVVNLESMPSFAPTELPAIDKFDLTIPVYRYVS